MLGGVTKRPTGNGAASTAAGGTGAIDPNWRYNPPQQPPAQPPDTTTTTGGGGLTYRRDPKLDELLRGLSGGPGKSNLGPLDLTDINKRGEGLSALLAQLMRGEGINVGDQSNDPAARAYAVAKQREAERMREAEAARGAVEGGLAGGDMDARAAQLRESTCEAIAANNADLTNRRRTEALATAIQGAGMQMSDLERQANLRRSEYDSKVTGERLNLERENASRADRSRLLDALLSEDRMNKTAFQKQEEEKRVERTTRNKEAFEKAEADRLQREKMQRYFNQRPRYV
jgi:hypothetical protein